MGRKKYKNDQPVANQEVDVLCPLCGRDIPSQERSSHHLTPVVKGGRKGPQAILHRICHSKIHSMLSERELADSYDTIEKLKAHDDIGKFIKWVKKKPSDYCDSNRLANVRRGK